MTDPKNPEPSELAKRIAEALFKSYGLQTITLIAERISTAGLSDLEAERDAFRATLHGIAKYAECDHRHHAEPCAACDAACALRGEEVPPGYYSDQLEQLEARLTTAERERNSLRMERDGLEQQRLRENEHLISERDEAWKAAEPFVKAGEAMGEVRMSREDTYLWVQSHSDPKDNVKISLADCDRLRAYAERVRAVNPPTADDPEESDGGEDG